MELQTFARHLVFGETIEAKLMRPGPLTDTPGQQPVEAPTLPGRPPALALDSTQPRRPFPTDASLISPSKRAEALHAFANHELLAIELMALCLLRFPDASPELRRELTRTIVDEQKHLRMYVRRLAELDTEFGDFPVNGWFWWCLRDVETPEQFLSGMSLTLEQANLDFATHYAERFSALGDERSANILRTVLQDEIRHVRVGASWLSRNHGGNSLFDAWTHHLPPPLTPARARGHEIAVGPRLEAGLPPSFVSRLQSYVGTKGRPVTGWRANLHIEAELSGVSLSRAARQVTWDLAPLVSLLGTEGDVLLDSDAPQVVDPVHNQQLATCGLPRLRREKDGGFAPKHYASWAPHLDGLQSTRGKRLHRKDAQMELREAIWSHPLAESWFGSSLPNPVVAANVRDLEAAVDALRARGCNHAWLKAPLGTSGRGNRKIQTHKPMESLGRWVRSTLDHFGAILVEPAQSRCLDLSIPLHLAPDASEPHPLMSLISDTGASRGHALGRHQSLWSPELRRAWHTPTTGLKFGLEHAVQTTRSWLRAHDVEGPAGIDMYVHVEPSSRRFCLRPMVELNMRYTMGHIAQRLQSRVVHGGCALWLHLSKRELEHARHASWTPLPVTTRDKRIARGDLFTTHEESRQRIVTLLVVDRSWDALFERLPAAWLPEQPVGLIRPSMAPA